MHRRLVRLTVVVIAASVGLFTMAFWVLLQSWMRHDADVLLASRARSAAALVAVDAGRLVVEETPGDEAVKPEMWLFDLRSSPVVRPPGGRSLDVAAATLAASGPATRVVSGVELRSLPVGDGTRRIGVVVVALGLAPYVHSERLAVGAAVALDLVIVLGAVVLVHRLVGSALRPVAAMTTRAREWAVHDLDQRFGLGPPRDEITGLAVTLDSLFARLAASLRHETLLTAQIAHELKAPLTRLRASAEASARYDTRPQQLRTALEQVISEVDQLAGVVETLLKAHNGSAMTGRVDLAEAAARVTHAATTAHPRVQVNVHGVAQPALCDPDLAERILAPIVDNALRYARSAITVQIGAASPGHDEASAVRVMVQDDGTGFRPDEVDAVFDPGYRGAAATGDGAGLGLPLARRLARLVGGDVLVVPERHGQVVVILPALPDMWRAEGRWAPSNGVGR